MSAVIEVSVFKIWLWGLFFVLKAVRELKGLNSLIEEFEFEFRLKFRFEFVF